MNLFRKAAIAFVAAVVVLTGLSGSLDGASASATGAQVSRSATYASRGTITISNYGFSGPGTLARHALITVRNRDSVTHTVSANSGAFSVRVGPHRTVTFRAPRRLGLYRFHCRIHSFMKGSLRVK